MKSKLFLTITILIGLSNNSYCQNNISEVNKIQGFYIFTDSQPLAEYDVIGEVTTNNNDDKDIKNSGGQYQAVRDYLIRSARQVNYQADGLILTMVNGGTDKAIIIKFKENASNLNQAKVKQYQGLYIFVDSEPIEKTEYIGTVKKKTSFSSSQYTSLREKLIKKCKKEFSDAKGLILKFVSGGTDTGDAIKYN
ncbi:hypothetical protein [Psychroserpens jangbogonensis]|uniref:hypothetical protein n=1 Tax=Psychroserpens jangbogonensis TaxID=1484460 RepID=UPI00053DCF10|nr:hypothetical protein [Psychroserpens jangbogonensis]